MQPLGFKRDAGPYTPHSPSPVPVVAGLDPCPANAQRPGLQLLRDELAKMLRNPTSVQ